MIRPSEATEAAPIGMERNSSGRAPGRVMSILYVRVSRDGWREVSREGASDEEKITVARSMKAIGSSEPDEVVSRRGVPPRASTA